MASDIVNQLTRNILSEITKKELLKKVLEQKESDGKNVEISNNSFEKFVKNVLISQYNLLNFFISFYRKLDCFKRQMERSDPLILMKIVGRRIQKKKRAQSIPTEVLKLAKKQDRFDYIALETVENDTDIINNDNAGNVEDDINIGLD